MTGDRTMDLLLDIHRGLPRQGPGDDASTLRALELCTELPARPDVLDIGCGPGMQTLALALATRSTITAVDLLEPFLDELRERAARAGLRKRIQVMRGDMADLPFGKHAFDLIWSEGAAYIMGIAEACTAWQEFLRPHGYLVISELCWLADVPQDVFDFFHDGYPSMTDVTGNIERIEACGFDVMGHFTLPDAAWWTDYYEPLAVNLRAARERYADDPEALRFIDESEREQQIRRDHGDAYGYEFFACRLRDPDASRDRSSKTSFKDWMGSMPDVGEDEDSSCHAICRVTSNDRLARRYERLLGDQEGRALPRGGSRLVRRSAG